MSWVYKQSTGELTSPNKDISIGYSGHGGGRNNSSMQEIPRIGPIPRGDYIIGHAYDDPHLGPCVMHLDPKPNTDTFGRSLFRIHGNDKQNDASEGCVIMGPVIRKQISVSDDKTLTVIE